MEFRHLGRSGLKVSAVSYGNWITHGSQLEAEQATACVRAALDAGITTFDTADVYANGRAETILGAALAGERRDGLEICTKVYYRPARVRTTPVCPANTFMRRSTPRCDGSRPITSIFTKHIATTTRRL
jgi:aryl-alcohol dehydrogenase-like predicted oxidoreductase